jgi:hypothetical protein
LRLVIVMSVLTRSLDMRRFVPLDTLFSLEPRMTRELLLAEIELVQLTRSTLMPPSGIWFKPTTTTGCQMDATIDVLLPTQTWTHLAKTNSPRTTLELRFCSSSLI